jgi:hypothetical protein
MVRTWLMRTFADSANEGLSPTLWEADTPLDVLRIIVVVKMEGVPLMINVLLLPDASQLTLLDMTVGAPSKTITAVAATTSREARCPVCHRPSSKVQSRYVRTLADLPCSGQQVHWLVQVRRFWCRMQGVRERFLANGCPRVLLPTPIVLHGK